VPHITANPLIVQLIGFVALGVAVLVYQFNTRKQILIILSLASLLFSIQFFLLGAYSGAVLNLINVARNYCFQKYRYRKRSAIILWGFIGIFSVATALTWQGPLSLLPAIGMISGAFANWQLKAKHIRLLSLVSPPAWFIYALAVHSYAAMLGEVLILTSILVGMYRLDRKGEKVGILHL
jgi:hypothetical protein